RIAAYDARSNESLTLIARGSGDAFDKAYNTAAGQVDDQLGKLGSNAGDLTQKWGAYKTIHANVRKTDATDGNWDGAVAMAVGNDKAHSSVDTFKAFDTASNDQLNTTSTAVQSQLKDARNGLPPIGWLGIPLGIA